LTDQGPVWENSTNVDINNTRRAGMMEAKERRKVRLSMDLDPGLHQRLKLEVAHRGENITEYVTRILSENLNHGGENETRKAS